LADVQRAIDNHTRINLQSGVTYEGETTITLSDGSGPNGQRTLIDARGAVLNYTGGGKRCIEVLPVGAIEGIPGPDRNAQDGTREARNYTWLGGTIQGPGGDVTDSAAVYAEDMFGCDLTFRMVGGAENGIWVRNMAYWSEANHLSIQGRRSVRRRETSYERPSKWTVRLDGGDLDAIHGTRSMRTTDVDIEWVPGEEGGYLWINGGASLHGGKIQIRGFLRPETTGLKVTGGGWNQSATAHVEWEGGENSTPVYIGPDAYSPLFLGPRVGHPRDGHYFSDSTIVNESDNPALCLMHDGIYNEYTEKLLGFGDKTPSFGAPVDMPELQLPAFDLHSVSGDAPGGLRRHDGSGDAPPGIYSWQPDNEHWTRLGGSTTITSMPES
jgi:hypothetical protein